MLLKLLTWNRHLCCAEGGDDEVEAAGREGVEEAEEEGLGAVAR